MPLSWVPSVLSYGLTGSTWGGVWTVGANSAQSKNFVLGCKSHECKLGQAFAATFGHPRFGDPKMAGLSSHFDSSPFYGPRDSRGYAATLIRPHSWDPRRQVLCNHFDSSALWDPEGRG